MRHLTLSLVAPALLLISTAAAQDRGAAPIASSPTVELKGKVQSVRLSPGQGTPFVEIETAGKTAKLYLGSIRYLMDQGFNPKVGDEITAKAYQLQSDYTAITVTLPAANKTVRLRDENGWPVWRGGRGWGRGRGPAR
jgi:hypothetical protein